MAASELNGNSQHRYATVLFADISGFTALSEKLDPEDVTAFINACFEKLESVVLTHGGIVDKYLGDCVDAVFGLSLATTNPAVDAVTAALEMRDAIYEFNRDAQLPAPLDVHIGVNSGPVIAGMLGGDATRRFNVMGDTVRLAARLEEAAEKGQIYVGPDTFERTHEEFQYRPLPPLHLEAHHAPVPIYQLLAPRQTRRVKRQSERRLATILFARVHGFEALSQHFEAETQTRIMQDCFATLGEAVMEFGGVVDKYLGDVLMALFGVPNAIEDAPRQAVNAAIEIRDRLAQFVADRQLALPLETHIGVNTGLVIAGDIGGRVKRDFTVMGDAVNLAARLMEAAAHGAIYIGPETYRYTRNDFGYRSLEPLRLKGKQHAVPAYELASVTKHVHRDAVSRADRMVFSELVGRDAEVATLSTLLQRLAAGNGAIVSLIGEAGLGKSRLVSEVLRLGEQPTVNVFLGRSLAIGRGQSFHPFVDLLRHWAGISEDAGDAQSLAALEAAVRAVLPDQADDVFPFIARLMGLHASGAAAKRLVGIEGQALEKLVVKSMRDLLQAVARQRPTALVFEDLHWTDQSSLNLLESLLPLSAETPLLFVHVFRPLFEDTSDRILQICQERFAEHHSEIRLEKLDAAQSGRLISNLLNTDDLPASVRTLIATEAEGNPFYIEEVVRSLIDEGAVTCRDGRFQVTDKINSFVIPGTIYDVIMARVDRLDESARQLLQVAAVVGRHFYRRIIAHIIEGDRPLDTDLAVLKEKQFIQERRIRWEVAVGDRSVVEELEYIFKHALAQEAVYESVLLKTRKELHRRVAGAIEALFVGRLPEFYATLAHHYTRAEQLEPAENYLCRAGEAAAGSAAFSEALQLFREAAAIYDQLHGPTGGDAKHRSFLEKHLGLALRNTGQHTESIGHFDHALELLGERVPKHPVGEALRWGIDMAVLLFRIYVYEGRRGLVPNVDHEREVFKLFFERGQAELISDPRRLFFQTAPPLRRYYRMDPNLIEDACGMYVEAGSIFIFSGLSFAIAKRMIEIAAGLLRNDNIRDVFRYRTMLFLYDYFRGNWSEAPTIEDAVIGDALRHGMVWDVTLYVGIEMDRRLRRGDFPGAQAMLRKLADVRDTYGYAYAGSNHNGMQAILLLEERQLRDALALTEQHHVASHEGTLKLMTLGMMAKAQVLLGDREAAAEALRRAVEVTKQQSVLSPWHQSVHHVAQLLFNVTALEAAAARGERAGWRPLKHAALRSLRRAIQTAGKVARDRVETWNLAARLWWVLGHRRRAFKWWSKSIAEATHLGAQPELGRTYMDIGWRIGTTRLNDAQGPTYLQKAEQIFSDLGLAWDLQQLKRLESAAIAAEPLVRSTTPSAA